MTPDTSSVYVFVRKHRRVRLRLRLLSVVAVDGRRCARALTLAFYSGACNMPTSGRVRITIHLPT